MATLVSINVSIRVLCFKDELSALRGGRKRLGFGYSTEDIDEAMKEIADIEAELLEDMYGVEINYAESMESINKPRVSGGQCRGDWVWGGQVQIQGRSFKWQ